MRGRVAVRADRRLLGMPVLDLALAAALAVLTVGGALTGDPPEGPRAVTVPVALVMSLALAARRTHPVAAVAVVMGAATVQTLVSQSPGSILAFAIFLGVTYSVAALTAEHWAALGGALVLGGLFLQEWHDGHTDYLFVVLVFGGAWLLGRAVRTWRARTVAAVAGSDDRTRLAVAEERLRIARELHDVVAHGLSVIAVQADAAEAALDHDAELARAPLDAVRRSARGSLAEMRQLLGVLRDEDDPASTRPQPGLADLPDLLDGFRRAGLTVDASVAEDVAPLPTGLDLAAYRIVQEGLTNALKHAGRVPTTVRVDRVAGGVRLEVANAAGDRPGRPGDGTGHGLVGLRERVEAAGGRFGAGAEPGGYRVTATLPVGEPS